MKNLLSNDTTIKQAAKTILRGSYPIVAKQLAEQLLLALKEIETLKRKAARRA